MRRGEILSLRWENIRLADQVALLPMTKNGQPRTVPLSKQAVQILNSLPRSLYGSVFPVTENCLKLGFVRAVKRAKAHYAADGGTDRRMLTDLRFHDLRHIAVTRLANKLSNIMELAAVSGHSDIRMLKRYFHPKAEDLAKKLG
jgi:integrase